MIAAVQRVISFDMNSLSWSILRSDDGEEFTHLFVFNEELFGLTLTNVSTIFKFEGDGSWGEIGMRVTDDWLYRFDRMKDELRNGPCYLNPRLRLSPLHHD
eukprot:765719-Hanusia_phi.AAC.5